MGTACKNIRSCAYSLKNRKAPAFFYFLEDPIFNTNCVANKVFSSKLVFFSAGPPCNYLTAGSLRIPMLKKIANLRIRDREIGVAVVVAAKVRDGTLPQHSGQRFALNVVRSWGVS